MRRRVARKKRANGAGSVRTKKTPGKPDRYQALGPRMPDGTRDSYGCFSTWEEADEVREAAVRKLMAKSKDGADTTLPGVTLRAHGERYLGEREHDVPRSVGTERSRWQRVLEAPFIDDPIGGIRTPALQRFLTELGRRLPGTAPGCKALLAGIFGAACRAGIIEANPVTAVKLPKQVRTHEPWTYLLPDEQQALLHAPGIPETDRLIITFALYSGVREGEQFSLRLTDVHLDRGTVTIRYGSLWGPPKGKKIRTVHLSPPALEALRRWLAILPEYCPHNPLNLVFPGPKGGHVISGDALRRTIRKGNKRVRVHGLDVALRAAGIVAEARHDGMWPRWHDLRHTCGSSLVAGWWGEPWRLEEVQKHLGHATITQTEQYAHLAPGVVAAKAARTTGLGPRLVPDAKNTEETSKFKMKAIISGASENPRADGSLEPTANPNRDQTVALCRRALDAAAARDPFAVTLLIDAVTASLELLDEPRVDVGKRTA